VTKNYSVVVLISFTYLLGPVWNRVMADTVLLQTNYSYIIPSVEIQWVCSYERMLQRTGFINKIGMLKRTRRNTYYRPT
jgi:hypothetical protein